jgi:hypothetical protein
MQTLITTGAISNFLFVGIYIAVKEVALTPRNILKVFTYILVVQILLTIMLILRPSLIEYL